MKAGKVLNAKSHHRSIAVSFIWRELTFFIYIEAELAGGICDLTTTSGYVGVIFVSIIASFSAFIILALLGFFVKKSFSGRRKDTSDYHYGDLEGISRKKPQLKKSKSALSRIVISNDDDAAIDQPSLKTSDKTKEGFSSTSSIVSSSTTCDKGSGSESGVVFKNAARKKVAFEETLKNIGATNSLAENKYSVFYSM
jgi:hypothetical protein